MMILQRISPWLVRLKHNSNSALKLIWFPYAGGDVWSFRNWSELLPGLEIWGVQYPGRGWRYKEPAYTELNLLVQKLASEIIPYIDQPVVFFGHSMGALVCFELTRFLFQIYGKGPRQLIVSGHRAPHLAPFTSNIHHLPEKEFIEGLRRYNGTPLLFFENRELMQLLIPTLRADLCLCETYKYIPGNPLPIPLTVFGGTEDPFVPVNTLDVWQQHTKSIFRCQVLLGDHFYLISQNDLLFKMISSVLSEECIPN